MNGQRGVIPALIIGGLAAVSALFFRATRPAPPKRRKRINRRQAVSVRVTENGKKYHRDNCPLLHGVSRNISVMEALQHYEPCKACHPPGGDDRSVA
ncbi:MAG: hypothetical protein JWQ98_696 [Chlorobi bacterium]|nr:hypothetical protein [Chlorobiota bacterium]